MLKILAVLSYGFILFVEAKKKMEVMKDRPQFHMKTKVDGSAQHEVIIAVKQRNLDQLHDILMERASPRSPTYQQWLTFEEVGVLTSNEPAAKAINAWLAESGVTVTWESIHHDYIKATTSIEVWENLLDASFHYYHDESVINNGNPRVYMRSQEYSIPDTLAEHIECIFNTVQAPPLISKHYHVKDTTKKFKTNLRFNDFKPQSYYPPVVTVQFLNSFYGITSNIGNVNLNQSVFETANEYFSQSDLTQFQSSNGLTQQKAIDIGGFETSTCSTTGTGKDCFEGNLDIQYIMGISQVCNNNLETILIFLYLGHLIYLLVCN